MNAPIRFESGRVGLLAHQQRDLSGVPQPAARIRDQGDSRERPALPSPFLRVTDRHGRVFVGAVAGVSMLVIERGGPALLPWLLLQVERANEGRRLLIAEPQPGHVVVYPAWRPGRVGPGVTVDLRGARIESADRSAP